MRQRSVSGRASTPKLVSAAWRNPLMRLCPWRVNVGMRPLSGEVINEPRLELGLISGQASLRDDPTIGAALSVYSALRSGEDSLSKEIAGLANN